MPKRKEHQVTVGIRIQNTDGCKLQKDHNGLRKPTAGQVNGHESPDTVDLTLGQLARLSEEHAQCTPSLACIAEVRKRKLEDWQEDRALARVNSIRRGRGLKDFGEEAEEVAAPVVEAPATEPAPVEVVEESAPEAEVEVTEPVEEAPVVEAPRVLPAYVASAGGIGGCADCQH